MKLIGVDSLNISGSAFTVQVNDKVQGVKLRELTQVKTNLCRVAEHRFLNFRKGIIYIQDYDIDGMEELKTGLQEQYLSVVNVEYSFFIKKRYAQSKAFILTFHLDSPPASIYIPCERNDTVVHPYIDRPLRCKN